MLRYGYREEAQHIALKWLNTVTRNYLDPQPATHRPFKYGDGTRHPGFLWEKYTRDGRINDDEYPCSFMLGWTASAYLVALETVRGARTPNPVYNGSERLTPVTTPLRSLGL